MKKALPITFMILTLAMNFYQNRLMPIVPTFLSPYSGNHPFWLYRIIEMTHATHPVSMFSGASHTAYTMKFKVLIHSQWISVPTPQAYLNEGINNNGYIYSTNPDTRSHMKKILCQTYAAQSVDIETYPHQIQASWIVQQHMPINPFWDDPVMKDVSPC